MPTGRNVDAHDRRRISLRSQRLRSPLLTSLCVASCSHSQNGVKGWTRFSSETETEDSIHHQIKSLPQCIPLSHHPSQTSHWESGRYFEDIWVAHLDRERLALGQEIVVQHFVRGNGIEQLDDDTHFHHR